LPTLFGPKSFELKCELNYYYDDKTGIGFHGDTERNIVVGLRLGQPIPLVFAWFHKTKPISEKITLNLNAGDLYILSHKAVGNDWKKQNLMTLRHAAGSKKYTSFK
jgi:alkylated DNA repair dioxygenase AlkB